MCRSLLIFLWLVLFSYFSSADEPKEKSFELLNGDRVLFLGNSFFERALEYGYLESAIALSFPDRDITFRNVGWDGDTVFGHCLLYTSPSPRDRQKSRMPSSA